MQLSSDALAAIKADLQNAAALWLLVNVTDHVHSVLRRVGDELVNVPERQATLSIESEPRGQVLIFTLEGEPNAPASHATLNYLGSTFETDDEDLIAWLEARAASYGPAAQNHLIALLTSPVPPAPAEDDA